MSNSSVFKSCLKVLRSSADLQLYDSEFQTHLQNETILPIIFIAELKQALQVIWDNLLQGPINKVVKNFTERLHAWRESWRWTLRALTVIVKLRIVLFKWQCFFLQHNYADCVPFCQHCLNMRVNDVVTGNKLITLPQLKIMMFSLALLREYKLAISLQNSALKFQVVAQKTAENDRGYFL